MNNIFCVSWLYVQRATSATLICHSRRVALIGKNWGEGSVGAGSVFSFSLA